MSKSGYRLEILEKYQGYEPREPENEPQRGGCQRLFLLLFRLLVWSGITAVILLIGAYIAFSIQLRGAIDQVVTYRGSGAGGTPRFFDRNGDLLFEMQTTEKRRWLAYNEIPDIAKNAAVAIEDDTFWTNLGFDPAAIGAALVSNYRQENGRPIGASTITQQLVKHIAFTYEERVGVSYTRKIREIFLAFIMTQQRSKQEILQMYLNEIYYGNLAYGIEAAAQTYFGKTAVDLTLAETAFLAGLPQAPLQLDPYTNFDAAKARQEFVLDLMLEEGTINEIDAQVAKGLTLRLAPRITVDEQVANTTIEAAHFVLYVQKELERRYGPDALVRGGWQITTSLDLGIHRLAEQAARENVAARAAAHDVSNGSVVILKPGTGEVLAMVGSLDYFNEGIDGQVNIALQPRQPGSSIKPITYAAAMERGWTAADVLWDVPIELDLGGGETMRPRNYSGRFHGPVLFRDALANSYNIPPIQIVRDIGVPAMISTARKMGVESLRENVGFYGLALTLGGGEVPLLEMTHAFATLANQGARPHLTSILRVTDSRGNVVFEQQEKRLPPTRALDPGIAYIITDILDDDRARVPGMGANNPLHLPFPAAAKTGTTNDFRDNWTIGYTPGVVVGVWFGNADGHPMQDSSGLRGAAPVWRRIMEGIYESPRLQNSLLVDGQTPPIEFLRPGNVTEQPVCLPAGTGGSVCTASRNDLFLASQAVHGIPRIGYAPDVVTNLGAWTLRTLPLTGDDAQRVSQAPLRDGTAPPQPTECVYNRSRSTDAAAERLFLPVPPYYPDEVRARLWARGAGYRMAPPTVCPLQVVEVYVPSERPSSGQRSSLSSEGLVGSGSGENSAPASGNGLSYQISSPSSGQQVSGTVLVRGSAQFDPAVVDYYKLEIGNGRSPTAWTTFGRTHSQPINNGVLEELQAGSLPSGDYTIRLVLVGKDGNFVGAPHAVLITVN
ncbi:MAG: transglycosylase domain-containing protein [Chloroflexota bacterium]